MTYDAIITITKSTKSSSGNSPKVTTGTNTIAKEVLKGSSLSSITDAITSLVTSQQGYMGSASIIIKISQ